VDLKIPAATCFVPRIKKSHSDSIFKEVSQTQRLRV
jgi:hypothetical protein